MAVNLNQQTFNRRYENWLKVTYSFRHVKAGLCSLTRTEMIELQKTLQKKHQFENAICGNSKGCTGKKVKLCKILCPNNICDKFVQDVVELHKYSSSIYWTNCKDLTKLNKPDGYWEFAKLFMGRGQPETNIGPQTTDCAGLLQVLSNCKRLKVKADNILAIRNKAFHSPDMSSTDEEVEGNIDSMIKFLQDLKKNYPGYEEITEAINELKELKKLSFTVAMADGKHKEIERECIEDVMSHVDHELSICSDQPEDRENCEKVAMALIRFITDRQDLREVFEDQLANLLHTMRSTIEKVENTENAVADLKHSHEELLERVEMIERELHVNGVPDQFDYKSKLNQLAQENRWGHPEYRQSPDARGYISKVTVDGKTFKTTEACRKKIDADQKVAKLALEALSGSEVEGSKSDEPSISYTDELYRNKEKFGISLVDYRFVVEEQAKFVAVCSLKLKCLMQVFNVNECQAADKAVTELDVMSSSGSSSKDKLNRLVQKYGVNPKYLQVKTDRHQYVLLATPSLQDLHVVDIEGECCTNKKGAKNSSASKTIKLLYELNVDKFVACPITLPNTSSASADCSSTPATCKNKDCVFLEILRDICASQGLEPPDVSTSVDNQFHSVTVNVKYRFSSDKEYQIKKQAEESAAKAALLALTSGQPINDDKKTPKTLLKELVDKNKQQFGQLTYQSSSTGPFHASVDLCISCKSDSHSSKSEAINFTARNVLKKLQLVPHLLKFLDDCRFDKWEFSIAGDVGKYRATLTTYIKFDADWQLPGYSSKKEAKKCAARNVLTLLYSSVDISNLDKCINLLQEKTPKHPLHFDEKEIGDKYVSCITVFFVAKDSNEHRFEYLAKDSVASEVLSKLSSNNQ